MRGGGPPFDRGAVGPGRARASDVLHLNTQVYEFWGQLLNIAAETAVNPLGFRPPRGVGGYPGPLIYRRLSIKESLKTLLLY